MEQPYIPDTKVDCIDFVTAADHNRQEQQLADLTAQVPLTLSLPQFSLGNDQGVIICHLAIPSGKIVHRVVMGVAQTDGSSPISTLITKLTIGTHSIETDQDYEEFILDPSESAGTLLVGSVENTTGSSKDVVGFITIFVEQL